MFQCNDETGKELYMSWVCDGTKDCTNGRDESDAVCVKCKGRKLEYSKFLLPHDHYMYHMYQIVLLETGMDGFIIYH